ncbi:MAG TPA: hypothetical protein GXX52_07855 [Synergistaceae bacterium]|nr:hypothetical protein [Synergistaceae bacterium]
MTLYHTFSPIAVDLGFFIDLAGPRPLFFVVTVVLLIAFLLLGNEECVRIDSDDRTSCDALQSEGGN